MIKKIAWEAFKNTGDINTYLELKQIEDIEQKMNKNELGMKDELGMKKQLDIKNQPFQEEKNEEI